MKKLITSQNIKVGNCFAEPVGFKSIGAFEMIIEINPVKKQLYVITFYPTGSGRRLWYNDYDIQNYCDTEITYNLSI
jgi:hypothetical protein